MAESILSAEIWYWAFVDLPYYVCDPIVWYRQNDPDWPWLFFEGGSASYLEWSGLSMCDLFTSTLGSAFIALGYMTSWFNYSTILSELVPGSGTLAALNSSANLAAEAQKMPLARVSASSEYPSFLAPYRSALPSDAHAVFWWNVAQDAQLLAWQAYWYYSSHPDWSLSNNAWRWQEMFWELSLIEAWWQYFVGYTGNASDGLVPHASAAHPGGSSLHVVLPWTQLAVHHKAQLDAVPNHDEDAFRVLVSTMMEQHLGIPYTPL